MPTVQLPNGKTAQFPDGMSVADIQKAIESDPNSGALPAGASGPLPGVPKAPVPAGLQGPPAPELKPGLRAAIDRATAIEPANQRPGIIGHAATAIGNVGAGFLSPLAVANHPLVTLKSVANTVATPTGTGGPFPDVPSMQESLVRGAIENPAGTVESALGGTAAGEVAGAGLSRLASPLQKAGAGVSNLGLSTATDAYGGNPGMAAAREGITGASPQTILNKTRAVIPNAAAEHAAVLRSAAEPALRFLPQQTIDIGDAVSGPFNSVRAAKTQPLTGAATPAQIARLNKTQALLTHEPDTFTGQPTTALRPLNQYTPLDANALKSSIYGMTDYDNPFKSSLANDALKQAAHGIKSQIETAVPESIPSGTRLHNLMALKDLMEAKTPTGIPLSKEALMSNAIRLGGTNAGAGLFRLGVAAPQAANLFPGLTALNAARTAAGR